MKPVYLDYNATAPVRPQVLVRMQELLAGPFNPSSAHRFGREAKKHLEQARKLIAASVSAWENEVVFTASATEANATVLRGFGGRRVIVSAVEHSSILSPLRGKQEVIPVTGQGVVDVPALEKLLREDPQPALVSVMLANNETGVIQPIRELSELTKKYGALLHCDAVQGLGKIAADFGALGVDMMTITGHKCGGPLGAAALVVRRDLAFAPLMAGGQELGRRAGTENVAAIAGFAEAVERAQDKAHMSEVRQWLESMERVMEANGATVFGRGADRLPNTVCVAMPGVSNEVQLMDLDLKGFAVSAGSACSSGRIEGSHVLAAMGVPKGLASNAIRVSVGWQTSQEDIGQFTEAWLKISAKLSKKAV